LILTKPLGTGIVGTAIKFGRASDDLIDRAITQMRTLNKAAAEAISTIDGVHACTDITGFGLAGHASEMAAGSHVTIEIDANALPIIPGVLEIASQNQSGGMNTNRDYFAAAIEFSAQISGERRDLVFDPQTSGGLLIAVAPESADDAMTSLIKSGIQAVFVGLVRPPSDNRLKIG